MRGYVLRKTIIHPICFYQHSKDEVVFEPLINASIYNYCISV